MKFAIAVVSHVVWPSCRGSRNSNALSAARRCAGGIQEVETRAIWPCDLHLDLVPDGGGGLCAIGNEVVGVLTPCPLPPDC